MTAMPSTFFASRRPSPRAAFGGLGDLARLFFLGERSRPVVCSSCSTMNAPFTPICKGCAGKLPAFYAAAAPEPAAAAPRAATAPRSRAPRAAIPPQWRTVAVAGLAVVTMFSAFGAWHARHKAVVRGASAQPAILSQVEQAQQVLQVPQLPQLPQLPQPQVDPSPAIAVSTAQPADGPAASALVPAPAARSERPAVSRRQALGTAGTRRAGARSDPPHRSADPLAQCDGRSYFARAICMSNSCTRPSVARDPRCVPVLQQRRMAEARRNPTQ